MNESAKLEVTRLPLPSSTADPQVQPRVVDAFVRSAADEYPIMPKAKMLATRRRRRTGGTSFENRSRSTKRNGRNGNEVPNEIGIDDVAFRGAGWADVEKGLLGWAEFTVNGAVRVDGVAVRRTLDGRYTLSFPGRQAHGGRRHFWVRPVTDAARLEIEHQVLGAIGIADEVSR